MVILNMLDGGFFRNNKKLLNQKLEKHTLKIELNSYATMVICNSFPLMKVRLWYVSAI
jgi:hypothetical protein